MVLITKAAGSTPMRSLPVLLALAAGMAVALAGPAPDPGTLPAAAAEEKPATAMGPLAGDADEVLVAMVPGDSYDLAIQSDGRPLEVVVRLHDGASLGGALSGPGWCAKEEFSTNVIALSTSGEVIAWGRCGPVAPGAHVLHIDGGSSAFVGTVRLLNATFAAP